MRIPKVPAGVVFEVPFRLRRRLGDSADLLRAEIEFPEDGRGTCRRRGFSRRQELELREAERE